MTTDQADKIRELHIKGEGYRSIAREIGLSRDIVRNYCKTHGLDGYANVLAMNIREQIELGRACLWCGKDVEQSEVARRKALITGLSQKILTQAQVLDYCR